MTTFKNIGAGFLRLAPRIGIQLVRSHFDSKVPKQGTEGSAGFDLHSVEDGCIAAGQTSIVSTGLSMAIPLNFVGLICSRSGLAAKSSVFVLNAPGVIDSDYRGEIKLILMNAGPTSYTYCEGDRLAQIMFVRHEQVKFIEVVGLDETDRGYGGFGSTGVAFPA